LNNAEIIVIRYISNRNEI